MHGREETTDAFRQTARVVGTILNLGKDPMEDRLGNSGRSYGASMLVEMLH
jgi:hypothetical protein